ncbi:MAG TPA: hypothetical protein VF228_11795 [Iamia sp.]
MGLTSCGGGSEPVEAGAGAEAAPSEPGQQPVPTTEAPGAPVSSPVDGLTAAELRAVVEAPPAPAPTGRRRTGPVADEVPVGDGTVWRITIPGRHEVLSSRIIVAIGGQDVGEGVVAPDLTALVVVVTDPAVVVAGAPVTYRWGAGDPVEAGPLEVVR